MHETLRTISILFVGPMALGAASLTSGCSGAPRGSGDTGDIGDLHTTSVEGELRVMISDHDDLSTRRHYYLGMQDGRDIELLFDTVPSLTAGAHLRVSGTEVSAKCRTSRGMSSWRRRNGGTGTITVLTR